MTHPVLAVGMDDPATAEFANESLSVFSAFDRAGCLRLLFEKRPKLIVIDVSGGQVEAPDLCQLIREMCDAPILCLTPGDGAAEIVKCLDAGADSCVTKPVGTLEFNARVVSLLRSASLPNEANSEPLAVGDLAIDLKGHRVTKGGVPLPLARREFDLLGALAEQVGCVVSHGELLRRVWGEEYRNDTHYLRLYIGYLRQKLEDDPRRPRYILTERGVGYRLSPDVAGGSEHASEVAFPGRGSRKEAARGGGI